MSSSPDSLPVFHTPLSLLHDPPHEILSGQIQPYFESPARHRRILAVLLDSPGFVEHKEIWTKEDVVTDELLDAVRAVHDEEYVDFLREVYVDWVREGGSKVRRLPCPLLSCTDPPRSRRTGRRPSRNFSSPFSRSQRTEFGRQEAEQSLCDC